MMPNLLYHNAHRNAPCTPPVYRLMMLCLLCCIALLAPTAWAQTTYTYNAGPIENTTSWTPTPPNFLNPDDTFLVNAGTPGVNTSLTIAGRLVVDGGATVNVNTNQLRVRLLDVRAGSGIELAISAGWLTITGTGTVNAGGSVIVPSAATLEMAGTAGLSGTGTVNFNPVNSVLRYSGSVTTGREWQASAPPAIQLVGSGTRVRLGITSSSMLGTMGLTLDAGTTLDIGSSSLTIASPLIANGGAVASNGGTFRLTGVSAITNAPGLAIDAAKRTFSVFGLERPQALTLLSPLEISAGGTLNLNNGGTINNTANTITINNTAVSAVQPAVPNGVITGAVRRAVVTNTMQSYVFPVGTTVANPRRFVSLRAQNVSSGQAFVEVQATNTGGGTVAAELSSLAGTDRWRVQTISGTLAAYALAVQKVDPLAAVPASDILAAASTQTGVYGGIGRTFANQQIDGTVANGFACTSLLTEPVGPFFAFATAAAPLQILSVPAPVPPQNTRNIAPTQNFSLNFSLPVTAATVSAGGIRVYGMQSGRKQITGSVAGGAVTHTLAAGQFFPNEQVYVSIGSSQNVAWSAGQGVETPAGVVMMQGSVGAFVTASGVGPGVFAPVAEYDVQTPGTPFSLFAADLNNDGRIDLPIQGFSGSVPVFGALINNGTGFSPTVIATLGASATGTALGDMDGDGDTDVVVTDAAGGEIRTYLNNGSTLVLATTTPATNPRRPIVFDADGNGALDVICADGADILSLRNRGTGLLTNNLSSTTPGANFFLQEGDFNNNGTIDLITLHGSTFRQRSNTGTGSFSVFGIPFNSAGASPAFRLADIDGDNDLDLVAVSDGLLEYWLNNGSGTYSGPGTVGGNFGSPFGTSIAVGDVNGDGRIDVVVASPSRNSVTVLRNRGIAPFFQPTQTINLPAVNQVVLADGDGDGDLDIAVAGHSTGKVYLLRNAPRPVLTALEPQNLATNVATSVQPTQTFSLNMTTATASAGVRMWGSMSGLRSAPTEPVYPSGSAVTAQNGAVSQQTFARPLFPGERVFVSVTNAQSTDLVSIEQATTYSFYARSGTAPATLFRSNDYATGGGVPRAAVSGDFDGDGDIDLAIANRGSMTTQRGVSVLLNNGKGMFTAQPFLTVAGIPHRLLAADLNNDGRLDLALSDSVAASITLWLNTGTATPFATPAVVNVAAMGGVSGLAAQDMNGDGAIDLIASTITSRSFTVLLNNGTGAFPLPLQRTFGDFISLAPTDIATGDMDGDGAADVILLMQDSVLMFKNNIRLASGTGATNLLTKFGSSYALGQTPTSCHVAPLRAGTRINDVVLPVGANNLIALINNGTGNFSVFSQTLPNAGGQAISPPIDLDGDGDLDLVSVASAANRMTVLSNGGGGAFSGLGSTSVLSQPAGVACGDFDGDGDVDAAVTNAGNNTVSVFINQPAPTLTATPDTLAFGNVPVSSFRELAYRLRGTHLVAPVTVASVSPRLTLSLQMGMAGSSSLTLLPNNGVIDTTVVARFAPNVRGSTTASIRHSTLINRLDTMRIGWSGVGVFPVPQITAFPPSGLAGQEIFVTGANFTFNGVPIITTATIAGLAAQIQSVSFGVLRLVVPSSGGVGLSGPIVLSTPTGSTTSTTNFTYIVPPVITSFAPVTASPGTLVTVQGQNFTGVTFATIGGVPVQSFTVVSPTELRLIVGQGLTGRVLVGNPAGTSASVSVLQVQNVAGILDFTPKAGTTGTAVLINGTNLTTATLVRFGAQSTNDLTVISSTQVLTRVPQGATTAPPAITLANGFVANAVQPFVVTPPPVISTISAVVITAGTQLVVTGANFETVTSVSIGGVAVARFTVRSANELLVIPSTSSGNGFVVVTNASGAAHSVAVEYLRPPTITSFSPQAATAGTVITITGTNFAYVRAVLFGEGSASRINVISTTQVQAVVPTTATTGLLRLFTLADFAVASQDFTYLLPPPPVLSPAQRDSLVLVQFYRATSVDRHSTTATRSTRSAWRDTTNWLQPVPISRWHGVTTDSATGRVTALQLPNNGLVADSLPTELSSLAMLRALNLSGNRLAGALSSSFATLRRLEVLDLSRNQFTALFPLDSLVQLRVLRADSNRLSGALPQSLCALPNVEELSLRGNALTGEIPRCLGTRTRLVVLDVSNNRFSGSIPPELGNLTNLEMLNVASNQLSGGIPPELGVPSGGSGTLAQAVKSERVTHTAALSKLRVLDVSRNRLSGRIPLELWNLRELRSLNLSHTALEGVLPQQLGNLRTLQTLRLNNTGLSGELPNALFRLDSLQTLVLDSCRFAGALPETLTRLLYLQELGIAWNRFTAVPNVATNATLRTVRMEGNALNFSHLEPNLQTFNNRSGRLTYSFSYAPQDSVGVARDTAAVLGRQFVLPLGGGFGGLRGVYQWFRVTNTASTNGVFAVPEATRPDLRLSVFTQADTGVYVCRITNPLGQALTLWSRAVRVGFIVPPVPSVRPTLLSPIAGAQNVPVTNTRLTWTAVPEATRYEVQLSTDASMTNPAAFVTTATVHSTEAQASGLPYFTPHYWRVRGVNEGGSGPWSELRTFTTLQLGAVWSAQSLDFGRVTLATTAQQTLLLTNLSQADLVLRSVEIVESGSEQTFRFPERWNSLLVRAGESARVPVMCSPRTLGTKTAGVRLLYSIATSSEQLSLVQQGVMRCWAGALAFGALNFGTVAVGQRTLRTVSMVNRSDRTVRLSAVQVRDTAANPGKRGMFALSGSLASERLAPNDTLTVAVQCRATDTGSVGALLRVVSDIDSADIPLNAVAIERAFQPVAMSVHARASRPFGQAGDEVEILLVLRNVVLNDAFRALGEPVFSATLRFSNQVLAVRPNEVGVVWRGNSTNDSAIVTVPPTRWLGKDSVLARFRCTVLSGSTSATVVELLQFRWAEVPENDDADVSIVSGSATFSVDGCRTTDSSGLPVSRFTRTTRTTTLTTLIPNPASDEAVLRYTLREQGITSLALYDAKGTLVRQIWQRFHSAGEFTDHVQLRTLASGSYILVLQTPSERVMMPLVVLR
jgi:Leucine-rich repeat (LRR) protein